MTEAQLPPAATLTYVDLPELSETFADSVHSMLFDGQTLRITFAVNRIDLARPPNPATGKRYPVCRLVLTSACAGELAKQLSQLSAALAQSQTAAPSAAKSN